MFLLDLVVTSLIILNLIQNTNVAANIKPEYTAIYSP